MINRNYIEKVNEDIISLLFSKNDEVIYLHKLINFFNENCDFSIYKFCKGNYKFCKGNVILEDNLSDFTDRVRNFDELIEFSNFYKSVNGDLSDCYFITEVMNPMTFIESTEKLIDFIKIVVSNSSLSKDESVELNKFLVSNFVD